MAANEPRSSSIDKQWLHDRYVVDRLSASAIAQLAGVPTHRVYAALVTYGIPRRTRGHNLRAGITDRPHGRGGQPHTRATRQAIALAVSRPCPARRGTRNGMAGRHGALNPNWKGGRSPARQRIQSTWQYQEFLRTVLERDSRTCVRCHESPGGRRALHVHHIQGWDARPDLRMESCNAVTLCRRCHEWVHSSENIEGQFLKLGVQGC